MKYIIFRNHTVEHLFKGIEAHFSAYGDLLHPTEDADVIIWFNMPQPQADIALIAREIDSYISQVEWLINNNRAKQLVVMLLSNRFNSNWVVTDREAHRAISEFNQWVCNQADKNSLVKFLDLDDYLQQYKWQEIFSWKYYLISQIILSPNNSKPFRLWFEAKMLALENIRYKCLVLDLDNTLWGGVVGEDGLSGIDIGDAYPGLAFRIFQEHLVEMSQKGVILAICSKNNMSDIEEVWTKHPNMILKKEHISAMQINWIDKATNIEAIAKELNIGLDSMVFIDDNPAERDLVRMHHPEVAVPQFPVNPYDIPNFICDIKGKYFQTYQLSTEDISKTEQYKANTQRLNARAEYLSQDDYLKSLEMQLTFMGADKFNIARISQMTQKTNQFNLTTKRYTVKDLTSILNSGHLIYCLNVKDKYGDNGITAAAIIRIDEAVAEIDSFLLSCRIIGRNIETQFLNHIENKLLEIGITSLQASYLPTAKNSQVSDFYDKVGFEISDHRKDGSKSYSRHLSQPKQILGYYKLIDESESP